MYGNVKDEIIIKLVGKLTQEFQEINQFKVREIAEEVLYNYDVSPQEKSLSTSDIQEKLQIYLATKKLDGLSKRTLKNYNYQLLIFAEHLIKPLATITTPDLRMYLAARCKNMKPSSVNEQISILKSFFKWLCDEEYITKNPTNNLKQTKEPKRLRKSLTDEEVEILRQVCETSREKALLEFLVSTGCRLSEAENVNKEDINWYERSLNVIGKGNKERKVYFNVKSKILLKKYLAERTDDSPALFVTSKGKIHRLGGRSIEREVKKISIRAGFTKSVFPHLMRHHFANHSLNAGMSITALQRLMGHSTPTTTIQIYAELNEENIRYEYKKTS